MERASPPRAPKRLGLPGTLRAQAARRLLFTSLAMLLAASLTGAAAYRGVVSNAARLEARTVETFYSSKLRELDDDWARQAYRQKARIDFLGLAESGTDRQARLHAYYVAQGEEQQFENIFLLAENPGGRKPVFRHGPGGDSLSALVADSDLDDGWLFDAAAGRLYRCYHQAVWLGDEGMGKLVLLRQMDDALLYMNTSSRTGLALEWHGNRVSHSLRSQPPEGYFSHSVTVRSSFPWPGGRDPAPVVHITHVMESPVSALEVTGAVALLLAVQSVCIWAVLGRWLVRVGNRVRLLGLASRRFTRRWPGEERLPLDIDAEVLSREDEISAVAVSLKGLTEAVARHDAQRNAHQEELRGLRNLLSGIVDSMPSALITVDRQGRITRCSRKAEALSGVSDAAATGRPLEAIFPRLEPLRGLVMESLREGEPRSAHKRPWLSPGGVRYEDVTVYPLTGAGLEGAVVRLDDVTERHLMEQLMIQSEKMLSVGGLAAGMAHEINNPLGGILQSAQVIERRVGNSLPANKAAAERLGVGLEALGAYLREREVMDMLAGIKDSAHRAARIVSGMLEFSRRGDSPHEPCDLTLILDKAVELSSKDYDLKKRFDFRKIAIERRYEPGIPPVPCSATQIEQVAMNLLRNAAQAMMDSPGGRPPRILLTTRAEGGEAVFAVEDNGPGLDKTAMGRVFEPFYTTKPPGIGTGLGLSVSYFIVTRNHAGGMEVDSSPGEWTRFTVRLPLAAPETSRP